MTRVSSRKGSALLIVLGMIGIMVISAVAFSAYMRYSRLPSSYLRRTSASRHLAHAALAEAIDQIDAAIGHNPHPGVGTDATIYPRRNGYSAIRNYWRDNCFIGTNELVEIEDTVSVLNLESLAYIPPSLVNEARYYSRHTPTASWQSLGYDAGRYAFFAIDVSDFLNANKTIANRGRNSSDRGKFTLAHAFENPVHTSYSVKPKLWDDFLDKYVDITAFFNGTTPSSSKMPFRSLADMGLAMYDQAGSLADVLCPFINYLGGGSPIDALSSTILERMKYFNVVADGLSPSIAKLRQSGGLPGDLSDPACQPFPRMKHGLTDKSTNREVLQSVDGFTSKRLQEKMSMLDRMSLYDYLDENSIPVSLAMPTTEKVPMICGLSPYVTLNITLNAPTQTTDPANTATLTAGQTFLQTDHYTITLNAVGNLATLFMYPFVERAGASANFTPEAAVRICFGEAGQAPGLRTKGGSAYIVASESEFSDDNVKGLSIRGKANYGGNLSWTTVDDPQQAVVHKSGVPVTFTGAQSWFGANELFSLTKIMTMQLDTSTTPPTLRPVELDKTQRTVTINPDFRPVDRYGISDAALENRIKAEIINDAGSFEITPHMTVTARVKKGSDTVDLVPACFDDDQKYNSINHDSVFANVGGGGGMAGAGSGASLPVMTFLGDKTINFHPSAFNGSPITVTIKPTDNQSVFCPDPRWNYAPENFVRVNSPLDPTWYTSENNPACGIGVDGRDRDIFMFVSNQGYMQSVSELAFLPRTVLSLVNGASSQPNDLGNVATDFTRVQYVDQKEDTVNWNLMWRTYRLYPQGGLDADNLYDLGVFDGGSGQRVNPYTTSQNALMSVFANTPYNWSVASTNNNSQVNVAASSMNNAEQFNTKYAFGPMNSNAKIEWTDLEKVVANVSAGMRDTQYNGNWCRGYERLDWAGYDFMSGGNGTANRSKFLNENLVAANLYDVDRKFLYGFWRDCFAAKQQLFLVFVRAEPMMMGSGSAGQAPPQLGARAMALVWRNPAPGAMPGITAGKSAWPSETVGQPGSLELTRKWAMDNNTDPMGDNPTEVMRPHQTRILFYRQFE